MVVRIIKKREFIKVWNALLLEYKLTPPALKVYLYFSGVFFWMGRIQIRYETIAENCGMSINTARKAIAELAAKQLLVKTSCFGNHNKRLANEYIIRRLSGGFTKIDKCLLKPQKDYTILSVFCSIAIHCNHADKAFPSISQICRDTGLGRTTVIAKLKQLNERGLVQKEHYTCAEGDYGHNNYTITTLPVRLALYALLLRMATHSAEMVGRFLAAASHKRLHRCLQKIRTAYRRIQRMVSGFIHGVMGRICSSRLLRNTS